MQYSCIIRGLFLCLALIAVTTYAQDTVAVAHVVYEGNNIYYADNESNLKYKAVTKGEDGMFTIYFTEERLKSSAIDKRQLRLGLGCNDGTCRQNLNEGNEPYLSELFPSYVEGAENQPLQEVWIVLNGDGTNSIHFTKPDIQIVVPGKKVIRFLAPWSNTSALLYLNGNENYMIPVGSPYCGWFEKSVIIEPKDVYVYFKQTIGGHYVGKDGISKEEIPVEQEILLDSVLAISDTVWVLATSYSEPELYSEFPDELGDCPVKNLPVMMFDWLHGDGSDTENRESQAGTTSQDFGTGGCAQLTKGMVEEELGPAGVPVRAANFPSNCKYTDHLGSWFLPEVVATDAAGNEYTNVTCRNLELTLDDEGFWLGQKNTESPEKGLFFLDDFKYLDEGNSIPNPMYDQIESEFGTHNYGFTMKIQAQFEYVKGQYFEFMGDDDVWVFINNKLVVDIGGQHHASNGHINLDKLDLVEGETYPFHIFYAERHKVESNFKMRTSIDLQAEASMFLKDLSESPKKIVKEVWQIVRERKLACDFSSSPETQKTERGPSNFVLFGKSMGKSGVALKTLDSLYYAGITVTDDFTKVTIDTKAIGKAQALPPGNYYIRVRLKSNPDEYKDIPFTIDPYELPNLAFANVKDSSYTVVDFDTQDTLTFTEFWAAYGDSLNRNISSDTLPINLDRNEKMWAGRSYPVYIMFAEEWASIYNGIAVKLSTSTPALVPCDSMGNPIDEVKLYNGRAEFFVKANDEVINGKLIASTASAKNKAIEWTNINIAVPPVPQVELAYIYDRNGDGRADSIWIQFNKPLGGQSVLDSMKFIFGTNFDGFYRPKYTDGEKVATLVAAGDGFGSGIFTGGATDSYSGRLNIWYTYTDPENGKVSIFPVEGVLTDKVGPVILAAEVKYLKDGNTQLTVNFSEGLDDTDASSDMFRFHCWKNERQDSVVKKANDVGTVPANQWKLIFPKGNESEIVPAVGDSIRFVPPSQMGMAHDLQGVYAHEDNPWVRITGEQKVTVTSPKVVTLSPESEAFDSAKVIIRSKNATVPKLVPNKNGLSADQVAAVYGTQGHFLGDLDMAELVENEIAEIVKAVQSTPSYVDGDEEENEDGTPARTWTIEEIIRAVDAGQMSIGEAEDRFDLDPVIVDAYENGLLSSSNIDNYARGTDEDIKQIVSAVADHTELRYEATYYSSLGHFVNRDEGTITCNDDIFKADGASNCLGSDGRLFLAWNMRSKSGRLAATGVYIARLMVRVRVNTKTITDRTQDFLWGVRRGKVNAMDLGI